MQFSLFGAAVVEPTRADLDGVILAGGWWVRTSATGLEQVRLSVVVEDAWRCAALVAEFAARELDGEIVGAEGGKHAVRTGFRIDLLPAAERWTRGARFTPPPDLGLGPGGLRLWTIVAGRREETGYLLGTADIESPIHRAAGAQLAGLGLAAVSVGERGRPGWRITGVKRLRRLAESLGEPPTGSERDWPE